MSHSSSLFPLVLLGMLGCALNGCGASAKGTEAKTAVSTNASPSEVAGGNEAGPAQPLGISDQPSGGSAANRPVMNGPAASAYAAGMQAFGKGDLSGAETQFNKAAEADPKAYQAFYSLGIVRERLGNAAGALSAYGKAISVVPDYEPAITAYGLLTAKRGNADAAEQYLRDRLASMPQSAAVTTALAEVKSIQGDSGAAQRLAREALKINPDYRPAMVTLARDHYRARRLDLALYALQGILDGYGVENPPRDKDNPDALLLRGLIERDRGQRAAAMSDFQRCLQLRPDLVEARVYLAAYYLESGNAAEAAPLLEGALRYDRDNLLARMNLGDAYRLLGKSDEAAQQLDWVIKKDPKLAPARYSLGLLYLFAANISGISRKQALDRAIDAFEEYKQLSPRSGPGQADDVDELIAAAKSKKALLEAKEAEAAAAQAEQQAPADDGSGNSQPADAGGAQ